MDTVELVTVLAKMKCHSDFLLGCLACCLVAAMKTEASLYLELSVPIPVVIDTVCRVAGPGVARRLGNCVLAAILLLSILDLVDFRIVVIFQYFVCHSCPQNLHINR